MLKKMNNTNKNFYTFLGPIFGSREVQRITGDRFFDDAEKNWYFHLDEDGKIDAVVSLKEKIIKNVYATNYEELVKILRKIYSLSDTSIVPKCYSKQYLNAGYMVYSKESRKFVTIQGGGHNGAIII